jgi:hypothetical protein
MRRRMGKFSSALVHVLERDLLLKKERKEKDDLLF